MAVVTVVTTLWHDVRVSVFLAIFHYDYSHGTLVQDRRISKLEFHPRREDQNSDSTDERLSLLRTMSAEGPKLHGAVGEQQESELVGLPNKRNDKMYSMGVQFHADSIS